MSKFIYFIHYQLGNCITANKHDHALKSGIEVRNGWKFTKIWQSWEGFKGIPLPHTPHDYDKCNQSKNLFFGFCGCGCSGTMKTTLKLCGKVRLTFGNCGPPQKYSCGLPPGYVLVKLNWSELGRANIYQSKTIVFAFKDGNMLELTDIGSSVIEFGDLNIISCSTC